MDFTQPWLSETPAKSGCSATAEEGLLKGQTHLHSPIWVSAFVAIVHMQLPVINAC